MPTSLGLNSGAAVRVGVQLYAYGSVPRQLVEEARAAEDLGYSIVWLSDSPMLNPELWSMLGAFALATSRICLGTGVTNPVTRLPEVTASAALSIQELSGNRLVLGVGVGDSGVRTLGASPATSQQLLRFILRLRELCSTSGRVPPLAYRTRAACPAIFIATAHVTTMRIAAELAEGAIVPYGPREWLERVKSLLYSARGSANRSGGRFDVVLMVPVALTRRKSDAFELAKPHVARQLMWYSGSLSTEGLEAQKALRESYDFLRHMRFDSPHARLVPDSVVPLFAIVGDASECVARIAELIESGWTHLLIRHCVRAPSLRRQAIRQFALQVLSKL